MKSPKIIYVMLVSVILAVTMPAVVLATSVEDMKAEEAQVKRQGEALSQEIDVVVENINQKYKEVAALDTDIANAETEIKETEVEIKDTEANIVTRTEVVKGRMQEMQIRDASNNSLNALLSADSFSDFISRAYAVTVLQNAEKEKIEALYAEQTKLAQLEEKLVATQRSLKEKQTTVKTEKAELDQQVAGLKTKLADNATTLNALTSERVAKENALREAAIAEQKAQAKREADAKAAEAERVANAAKVNTSTVSTSSTNSNSTNSNQNSSNNDGGQTQPATPTEPTPTPTEPATPSGNSFSGQATAYIATGNNTATGTVPTPGRTIAVDPRLIPLGSRVMIEVHGLPQYSGIYTAEDTGGVVKGPIVDIFVKSQGEAQQFGRRSITITIL